MNLTKWENKQTKLILNDINRWLREESIKQNYLETKRSVGNINEEDFDEIIDYDDSYYDDGLSNGEI